MLDIPAFEAIRFFLIHTTPGMPMEAWWLSAVVLLVLGAAALVDAITSTVPDPLIFLGLLVVTTAQGLYVSWPFAAEHLTMGLITVIAIWAVNQLWYRFQKTDAIGMGDAKWTMLAVACFGVVSSLLAWGIGACLAIIWIGAAGLMRRRTSHVYFAPFLFIGLIAGLAFLSQR